MLKRLLLLFPACCLLVLAAFSPPAGQNLKITVTRLQNNSGVVLVSLFKDGNGFPDDPAKAFAKQKGYIADKSSTVIFKDVPPGNYAVAILHDANSNQKMDKNFLGIPKEGYGFSNNASAAFGPPSYRKASFAHGASAPTELSIKAKYL